MTNEEVEALNAQMAADRRPTPIVHDPVPAGMEPDPEPELAEPAPAPELTRTTRVAGHEVADKLRQERRVKRLEEKGY